MAELGARLVDSADSAVMKAITRYVLTPAIIVLCGISTMYLRSLADKVDNAAAKADVEKTATLLKTEHDRANAAMWVAIATATRAQADLTTTVAVLKSQFEEQRQTYAGDITNVRLSVREIQDRLAGKRN